MPELGEAFAAAVVVGVAVAIVSGLVRSWFGTPRGRSNGALLDGLLAASVAGLVVAVLSPAELMFGPEPGPPAVNLQPFDRLDGAPVRFAVINLLLLMPTVFLLAQRWRRAGVVRLTLLAFATSITIELLQLFHPTRGTNVDDLALNTLGAAAAAVLGVVVRRLRGAHVPRRRGNGRRPLEAEVRSGEQRAVERAS